MDHSKNDYRTNGSLLHSLTHSCLGRICILAVILAVVLAIARFSVPDKETMTVEIEDAIRQCIIANDSIPTDDIDDAVNNIGYIFTYADSTKFNEETWELFNKYNKLEYYKHSFYSTMHVKNNFRPVGNRVGIGIFGVVIPTVNYHDFPLDIGPIHKGYDEKIIKTIEYKERDLGTNPDINEYHYKGNKED